MRATSAGSNDGVPEISFGLEKAEVIGRGCEFGRLVRALFAFDSDVPVDSASWSFLNPAGIDAIPEFTQTVVAHQLYEFWDEVECSTFCFEEHQVPAGK